MLNDLLFRLRAIFRRRSVEAELDDELRFHLEQAVEKLMRSGLSREEASRRARRALGGLDQVKEECRDARGVSILETAMQDIRHGMRGLRRNPGLAILATLTLSLGMAASTLMFSIFQATLLRPMPFREADRVAQLWETRLDRGMNRISFTEANFWDLRAQNHSFEEVAAIHSFEANMTGAGPAEKVSGSAVTVGFFRTLGVAPILGRDFLYEEDRGGMDNRVVILGARFWRNKFNGDPKIIGKTLRLNDQIYTVVGVAPAGEPWLNEQMYMLFGYRPDADRGSWEFEVIGRLATGVSEDAARADLQKVAGAISQSYPEAKGLGFQIGSSSEWGASNDTRRALWVLLGAVTFLLLIGCMNVANLLLARGTARQREIAVRLVLGASRARLARFVMMEALLLSGFGVALGVALAYGALHVMQSLEISGIPRLADASLNLWVLGFATVAAAGAGLLSGLAPALQGLGSGVAAALRESDRQKGSRGQGRLRAALVTCEVALSFLLLVGAGLLIRSFAQLMKVNHGFQTENRLMFSISMPDAYGKDGVGKQFMDRFLDRLSAVPGVIAVGAVGNRPVEGGNPGMGIDSSSQTADRQSPWAGWRVVTPGYFRAVGLPLLRGRVFDENDKPVWAERGQPAPARRVMISNQLAKLIFPNEDPVGKHVSLWKKQGDWDAEVIGVVGDSRERGLTSDPTLTVYLPYGRNALATEFVAHTSGKVHELAPVVRSIVADLDPNLPVTDIRSFQEVVTRSVAPQRFNAVLLGVFSGLALLLATTGIYGLLSYTMSRRTSEIGLRMALGASASSILRMTVSQGMRPALLGIGLGAAGALWLSRYLAALLFDIKPYDILTYAAVAALLLATALAACCLPGRRAMRTDPAVALRIE
ncbi:MAG TPA: ABC transporter permease [Blastocatellia bacterium]